MNLAVSRPVACQKHRERSTPEEAATLRPPRHVQVDTQTASTPPGDVRPVCDFAGVGAGIAPRRACGRATHVRYVWLRPHFTGVGVYGLVSHAQSIVSAQRSCGDFSARECSARDEIVGESKLEENEGGRGRTMTYERKWDKM
ncbi:hypothetical protein C8J57DRAFT_1510974 [Mycena rebaudengoi]|nr:hypothetical protein C8J57DRAFT_1510974 [Mycena rebaudengoi]